tara:strand:+ start:364 stop:732 length:369 start_codon:yes stop_codon:yes gene_type:complete
MKIWIVYGSFFSLLAIVLGAFGAHGLKNILDQYSREIYEKAIYYHFIHSLAIILIAILNNQYNNINLSYSVYLFLFGIIIFSGSLYVLAITGIKWLGAITPIGGLLFIFGWVYIIVAFLKHN